MGGGLRAGGCAGREWPDASNTLAYLPVLCPLAPGTLSPRRDVPAQIARPEYVDRPAPKPFKGSEIKTPEIIERMRVAGRIAAEALREAGKHVEPGVSTDE